MLRRKAALNRSRFLVNDSDDEYHTSNAGFYGFEVSEGDSAIESLDDQDDHIENQDNCSVDTTEEEGGIEQMSLTWKVNSQIESWSNPVQHVDGTSGIPKGDFVGQVDSCVSFDSQTNMDGPPGIPKKDFGVHNDSCVSFECHKNMVVSFHSCGLVDASPALQARGFKCDQSPSMPFKLDLSSNMMGHVYLLEPGNAKDWYTGYSTGPATDIDFLPTSNLIDEFFSHHTPDRKTRSD